MTAEWGPLATMIGDWQGDGGLDSAWSHTEGKVLETPYRETIAMKPFGPVVNGAQTLYGLDYRGAMWRAGEDEPFHTEVGYWLWDAAGGEAMRGFVVPRGVAVMAGGKCSADATDFTMSATLGTEAYSIGENTYLSDHASTRAYEMRVRITDADTWSYRQTTVLRMDIFHELFPHTDTNTLHRVS